MSTPSRRSETEHGVQWVWDGMSFQKFRQDCVTSSFQAESYQFTHHRIYIISGMSKRADWSTAAKHCCAMIPIEKNGFHRVAMLLLHSALKIKMQKKPNIITSSFHNLANNKNHQSNLIKDTWKVCGLWNLIQNGTVYL